MKIIKLKHPIGNGDKFLRGKVISIDPTDNRHFWITIQYKTVSNKKILAYID